MPFIGSILCKCARFGPLKRSLTSSISRSVMYALPHMNAPLALGQAGTDNSSVYVWSSKRIDFLRIVHIFRAAVESVSLKSSKCCWQKSHSFSTCETWFPASLVSDRIARQFQVSSCTSLRRNIRSRRSTVCSMRCWCEVTPKCWPNISARKTEILKRNSSSSPQSSKKPSTCLTIEATEKSSSNRLASAFVPWVRILLSRMLRSSHTS